MSSKLPSVKIESFEGPFDLLLELARRRKVDLSEISLRAVTNDFLQYIAGKNIPLSIQGDFLVVAATLLLMKIRLLSPQLTHEEEQEVAELTDRVRIYQLYREKADSLREQWGTTRLFPAHFWSPSGVYKDPNARPVEVSTTPESLGDSFSSLIKSLPKPVHPKAHLRPQGRTLRECLSLFNTRLKKAKRIIFQDAVTGASAQDTAVSFLAVLELARKQAVSLEQDTPFDRLVVHSAHE